MKHLKAVIFDMDGTLLDTETIARDSWHAAAEQFHFDLDENFYHQMIGLSKEGSKPILDKILPADLNREKFHAYRLRYFMNRIASAGLPSKPGMIEILEYLKDKDVRIALATSTWKERMDLYFTYVDIRKYFSVIVNGDHVVKGKPDPEIYETALSLLDIDAKHALVIEDSVNGVRSAAAAGIDTIVVPDCIEPTYDILKQCLTRAHDLFEVMKIIEHL